MKIVSRICAGAAILTLILSSVLLAYAEEAKVKSVEVVPETAVAVLHKVEAFFKGDLTWTMPAGQGKYKNDYAVDPLGNKVPRSTLGRYDDGVR